MLSKRASLLKPSATLVMAGRAREMIAAGKDVVSLTVGEPDWNTFPAAAEAGIKAIRDGFTKYTAVNGIVELREAIAKNTNELLKTNYGGKEVCVGAGAKFVIFAALQMLLDESDEVLIPAPYWVSYPVMVSLAGGRSKIIECTAETHFKLTPEALEKSISPRSKILILCSPSNPTGLMYSEEEMKALASVLKKHPKLFVISDDIYNRLIFNGETVAPHLLQAAPELKEQMLVVNGASKSYAMTGWRLGWGLGPEKLMQAISDFNSQSTSNVTSITQKAVLAALANCEPDIARVNQDMTQKKNWLLKEINEIKGFHAVNPDGAFYLWTDVRAFAGKRNMKNCSDVANRLLEEYFVATVPGIEFGSEGYLRLSFAASEKDLKKALDRLRKFSQENL